MATHEQSHQSFRESKECSLAKECTVTGAGQLAAITMIATSHREDDDFTARQPRWHKTAQGDELAQEDKPKKNLPDFI